MPRKGSSKTYDRIVESAAGLFHSRGFNLVGIQDILDASGVSRGAFYFYFPSKEELCKAVIDFHEHMVEGRLRAAFAPGARWDAGVEAFVESLLRPYGKRGMIAAPLANLGLEFAHTSPRLLGKVAATLRKAEGWVATLLVSFGFEPGHAARRAETVLAVHEGHLARFALTRDSSCIAQMKDDLKRVGLPPSGNPGIPAPRPRVRPGADFPACAKFPIDFVDDQSIIIPSGWQARRREIVTCASGLFWKRGFFNTSIRDVLDGSGVPKGSFYYYFRSKRALGSSVLDEYRVWCRRFLDGVAGSADWRQAVEWLCLVARGFAGGRGFFGCPLGNMGLEFANTDRFLRRKVAGIFGMVEQGFARVLSELRQSPAASRKKAALVLALWQGHLTRMTVYRDAGVVDQLRRDLLEVAD